MRLAAEPVTHLAGMVRDRVDRTTVCEEAQRSIHGREADRSPSSPEASVEVLRCDVVLLARELGEDEKPLAGVPEPERSQTLPRECNRPFLTRHVRYGTYTSMRTILDYGPVLALSRDMADYAAHFGIDVLASLATVYAQRFCHHRWHQVLVWLALSIVVTVTTVNLVG
jgi:hypothetical protein